MSDWAKDYTEDVHDWDLPETVGRPEACACCKDPRPAHELDVDGVCSRCSMNAHLFGTTPDETDHAWRRAQICMVVAIVIGALATLASAVLGFVE